MHPKPKLFEHCIEQTVGGGVVIGAAVGGGVIGGGGVGGAGKGGAVVAGKAAGIEPVSGSGGNRRLSAMVCRALIQYSSSSAATESGTPPSNVPLTGTLFAQDVAGAEIATRRRRAPPDTVIFMVNRSEAVTGDQIDGACATQGLFKEWATRENR